MGISGTGVSLNKMDCSAMKMHKISKILEFGMYFAKLCQVSKNYYNTGLA